MHRQTNSRRQTRSTALVASALAVVGSIAAPSALLFADAPARPNEPTATAPPAASATPTSTQPSADAPVQPNVIVETIETQTLVEPSFNAQRPRPLDAEEARKFDALVELYAYAYPLVLANEIKRETTSRFFLTTANETFYFPRLPDARYRATEFPNVDSIFATAWLDLARETQIVVAPADARAPFSLEIVDAWSNVVASFDEKTLAELPSFTVDGRSLRALALVGPNSPKPTRLPPEIRVVEAPSSLVLVLTRVFVKDSPRVGAFGTRPFVQTLYDFATVSESELTSILKTEKKTSAASDAALVRPEKDDDGPETPTQPKDADAEKKSDAKTTPNEEETPVNQELAPPQTGAFNELKRLYVAQNAARYAESTDEKTAPNAQIAPQTKVATPSEIAPKTDKPTDVDASSSKDETEPADDKTSANVEKPTLREQADAAFQAGEQNYKRERNEEENAVENFWRDIQEREHEAARAVGSSFDDVKSWFHKRLGNDKHFWNHFDEALKRDARRDLRRIEQMLETPRPTRRWFEGPVERVERTSPEKYWSTFVELLKTNPPTKADAKIVDCLKTLGVEPGQTKTLDADLRRLSRGAFSVARKKIEIAAQLEIWRNAAPTNWIIFKNLGNYGDDYFFRAGAAGVAFGVNVEKNVVYPFTFLDASGEPLDGDASYVLRFSSGEEPPTDFLWSITLYNADGYLVSNESDKYGVRSDQPLKRNDDGSLEILIQHEKPQGDTTNWIPAPRGPFMLAMRVYRPNEKALNGDWTPPAIQKIQRETTVK